ncbi:CotH kinase family protein [Cryobacterium sp. 1639]|uniref:CotH kinase family protein n=1 Tax=Cryobacterium inferilacus TaxID=2866629 RepID=UPI001C73AFBE|nr:CotH kinase family protein [Cryobacterium sp. 1639]MBX0301801.1 CotH kinase family protein [Cryobacterium sp. 1639]
MRTMTREGLARRVMVLTLTLGLTVTLISVAGPPATAAPQTPNLPTLNITLADPDASRNTLSYVHASKDNKVATTMTLEDPAGAHNITTPALGEIKGRGNHTWKLAKKPYQIKFDQSTAVLGMAPSKTWILLANAADASLMRNKVAFELATAIGLAYSPESKWVDLRVNGKYLGNYLISEKTEVKENRVDLAHPQGVLVELDNSYGAAEPYNFRTNSSRSLFVLKEATSGVPDPDEGALPADTLAGWNDVKNTLNRVDAILAAPQVDWAALSALIDVDSFVKFYYVFELTANPEITQSSVYFYKNGPGKLFAGPVWDFDTALGNFDKARHLGSDPKADYAKNAQLLQQSGNGFFFDLFRSTEFVQRANQLWQAGISHEVGLMPAKISRWENEIKASAAQNFAVWPILGTKTLLTSAGKDYHPTYAGEVGYLRDWVSTRAKILIREQGATPMLRFQAHVQNIGWQRKVNTGQVAGTIGQALRTEAFILETPGSTAIANIEATVHVENLGWMGWHTASRVGTTGLSLRMEAIQFRLTGALASQYDISYRVHVQNIGWQSWVSNSATAGTTGQAKRVEAVQVRLLAKGSPTLPALP